jgi:predicted lipid-binding transport protein (Tim44 family)
MKKRGNAAPGVLGFGCLLGAVLVILASGTQALENLLSGIFMLGAIGAIIFLVTKANTPPPSITSRPEATRPSATTASTRTRVAACHVRMSPK